MKKYSIIVLLIIIYAAGCTEKKESPTKGNVTVYSDESVYPLISQMADSFNILYPEAHVTVTLVSSKEAVARLVNKESEISITSRSISAFEDSVLKLNNVDIRTLKFAYDGVVLVADYSFENKIKFSEMTDILTGTNRRYRAVLPADSTSVTEYLVRQKYKDSIQLSYISASDDAEVVDLVRKNKNLVGFISHAAADTLTVLKKIEIGAEKQIRAEDFYFPAHPGFYVQELYPLTRLIYIYLTEVNIGTASGFATFLTGNIGQKAALDRNFGPAAVPVRIRE